MIPFLADTPMPIKYVRGIEITKHMDKKQSETPSTLEPYFCRKSQHSRIRKVTKQEAYDGCINPCKTGYLSALEEISLLSISIKFRILDPCYLLRAWLLDCAASHLCLYILQTHDLQLALREALIPQKLMHQELIHL
jgi:hypothetical protein